MRMRIPSLDAKREEFRRRTAIVRELHIYGEAVPLGESAEVSAQHKGLGSSLLSAAENIASAEFECKQIAIISGIGVREYYVAHGYGRPHRSPYMLKSLS